MKSKALIPYRISCIRERKQIENHCNKKARLEAIVTGFKSNNEEYLKIKETAVEKVKDVLNDRKILLQLRHFSSWLLTKSLIEELIINI